MNAKWPIWALTMFLATVADASASSQARLRGPYLGQTPPGDTPQVFAAGIVSMKGSREYCLALTSDGREIYFNRAGVGVMACILTESGWTQPRVAEFSDRFPGGEVHVTPDGRHLLMNRYARLAEGETGGIWSLPRANGGWGDARFLIPQGMRATSTRDGAIYATDIAGYRVEGRDGGIIARWIRRDEEYRRDADPGGGVNTPAVEAHPFIAPDERYLIFNSPRAGGKGEGDLYVSFRRADGSWGGAVNLEPLNSAAADWCATVSPDGRYLFFTRNSADGGDIYWVSAGIIERFRETSLRQ
jgi:hypothetical protein